MTTRIIVAEGDYTSRQRYHFSEESWNAYYRHIEHLRPLYALMIRPKPRFYTPFVRLRATYPFTRPH
jgi:hypothetical protein